MGEKPKRFDVKDESLRGALHPGGRIALARECIVGAVDFGDRELRCVVVQPRFGRW